MQTKYNATLETFQTHSGSGKFSSTKRVATSGELNRMAVQREAIAASTEHRSWLDENGYDDIQPDELFAGGR